MEKNDLEALKLLKDWSTALVGIQTGAIAAIGAIIKLNQPSSLGQMAKVYVTVSIGCFTLSFLSAAYVLMSLPGIAQRLPPPGQQDIFSMGTLEGRGIRLVYFVLGEHIFFIAGILSFALFILRLAWT